MTDRASRRACEQVGRHGRSVAQVAADLGCDWHTVNRAVVAYGLALVDDPDRIGPITTLGLDETAFVRGGPYRRRLWSTQLVGDGQLLDVVEGRDAGPVCARLALPSAAVAGRHRMGDPGSGRLVPGGGGHDAA